MIIFYKIDGKRKMRMLIFISITDSLVLSKGQRESVNKQWWCEL